MFIRGGGGAPPPKPTGSAGSSGNASATGSAAPQKHQMQQTLPIPSDASGSSRHLINTWSSALGAAGNLSIAAHASTVTAHTSTLDPSFGPLKLSQVNRFFTDPGKGTTVNPNGTTTTDLGGGVSRVTLTDTSKTQLVRGITGPDGTPVTYQKSGANLNWNFDHQMQSARIQTDAGTGAQYGTATPKTQGTFTVNGDPVKYSQFPAGQDGNQFSKLTFADRNPAYVYSQGELPSESLKNIATAVRNAPPETFNNVSSIVVHRELGGGLTADGTPGFTPGSVTTGDPRVNVTSSALQNSEYANSLLTHESGHVLDNAKGLSSTIMDPANPNHLLFGSGQHVTGSSGETDLSKSSFVSEYASRNPAEDFATTHDELVNGLRASYSANNGGQELFSQPSQDVRSFIEGKGYSPAITNKMMAIAEKGYDVKPAVSGASGTAGDTAAPGAAGDTGAAGADAAKTSSVLGSLGKAAPIIEKVGGVAGVVGGGLQIGSGISELEHGKTLDGSLDTASGALTTVGGAALATGVGAVAAPFLFGAGSAVGGVKNIIDGIHSGNAEKIGVGAAEAAGGGMMIAGGALTATGVGAVVGVPLMVAGGIVAGGAALYDSFHKQIDSAISTGIHDVGSGLSTAGHDAASVASDAWNAITSIF